MRELIGDDLKMGVVAFGYFVLSVFVLVVTPVSEDSTLWFIFAVLLHIAWYVLTGFGVIVGLHAIWDNLDEIAEWINDKRE